MINHAYTPRARAYPWPLVIGLTLLLCGLAARCRAGDGAAWFSVMAAPYPQSMSFYSQSVGWWQLAANDNPQPDTSAAPGTDLTWVGSSGWSSANGGTITGAGTNYLARSEANWNSSATNGTILMWIKPVDTVDGEVFFSSGDVATTTYRFYVVRFKSGGGAVVRGSIGIVAQNGDTSSQLYTPIETVAAGSWISVAVVSTGSAYAIYLNAVGPAAENSAGGVQGRWFSSIEGRDNVTVGARVATSLLLPLRGSIGEVVVVNATLTQQQIQAWHDATKAAYQ